MTKAIWNSAAAFSLAILVSNPSSARATPASDLEAASIAKKSGNLDEAFRLTLAAARAGLPKAQSEAAAFYLRGQGTTISFEKGMFWVNKAVQNKDPYGYNIMSIAYLQGEWVTKDLQKAFDYAKLAKEAGYFNGKSAKESALFDAISAAVGEDNYNCMTFGFRQGTPSFSQCAMQMAQSRRQEELAQKQYQLQVQQYNQQAADEEQRQFDAMQAQEFSAQQERDRKKQEAIDRLNALSEDLACPKTGPGMFAEPVAGCGRNKNKSPQPNINVIVPSPSTYCGRTAAGPIRCR